jgi:hypothetical protein
LGLLKEVMSLRREWLADARDADGVKADVLASLCDTDNPLLGPESLRSLMETVRRAAPGPDTHGAALFCLRDSATRLLPVPSGAILEQLASGVCHADTRPKPPGGVAGLLREGRAEAAEDERLRRG